MSKASQYLFALPAPWCGVQGTSQRRVPAPMRISRRVLATPPAPQPPPNHQGSRCPSVPGKAVLVFSIAGRHSQLIVLRLRCTTRTHSPWSGPCTRTDMVSNREVSVQPGSSLTRNNILPPLGHGRPAHPPRAPVLSLDRRAPRFRPYGSLPQDCCSAILLTAAITKRPSYNHSSAVVFPGGVHSTVVAVPSPPNDGQACPA